MYYNAKSRQSNIHVQWLFVAQYWNNCWFVNGVRSESILWVDPLLVRPKWVGICGPKNLENSENVDTVSQGLSASSQSSIFSTRPHKWTLHILFESLMKKRKKKCPWLGSNLHPLSLQRSIYPLSYGTCVVVNARNWAMIYNCEGESLVHFSKARFLDP